MRGRLGGFRTAGVGSGAGGLVVEEEPHHLGRRVRTGRIGVGAGGVAAEPGVGAAVHGPVFGHDGAVGAAIYASGVAPAAALAGLGGDGRRRGSTGGGAGQPGGDELVGVGGGGGFVPGAREEEGRHWTDGCCRSPAAHRAVGGGDVVGGLVGQPAVDARGGV